MTPESPPRGPADGEPAPAALPALDSFAGQLWSMPVPLAVTRFADGEVLLVNAAFEQVTGFRAADLVGRRITESGIYVDTSARGRLVQRLQAEGVLNQAETEIRTRAGERRTVSVSARRVPDPGGDRIIVLFVDITTRKEMEVALREGEERYRRLFHESADAILVLAWEAGAEVGRVVEANDCAAQLLDIPRPELPGLTLESWDAPGNPEPVAAVGRHLGSTDHLKFERLVRTRQGETRVLEVHCRVFRWQGRRYVLAGLRDLTSHRRLEEQLRESERSLRASARRFERLAEAAPTGILMADHLGRIAHLNAAAKAILGVPAAALCGREVTALACPEDAGRVSEAWAAMTGGARDALAEVRVVRPDGERRWVLLHLHPQIVDQRIQEVIASLTDWTEHRQTTDLLRVLVEARSAGGPFLSRALAGLAPVFAADSACIALGEAATGQRRLAACWRDGELRLDPPTQLAAALSRELLGVEPRVVPSQLATVAPETAAQLASGAEAALIVPLPSEGGAICGHLCLFWRHPLRDLRPLQERVQLAVVPLAAEIERDREALAKRRIESQLLQSQKFESLGALVSGMAHDFNNVLAAVLNYTTLTRMLEPAETAERNEYLDEIAAAVRRARDLVGQIVTFSRHAPGQAGEPRLPVSLRHVVADALRFLRPAIFPAIRLEYSADPGPVCVQADSTRIHQVLMNLLINAAQAIGDRSGTIALQLDSCLLTAEAGPPGLPAGRYVRLTVSDTGIGIPAEVLPRIFEPFFTTRGLSGGSGLGLALVRQIVEDHGGAVTVRSQVQSGTVFTLYLPAVEGEPAAASPSDTPTLPRGSGQHVLLVDNDPAVLRSAELMLAQLGYRVSAWEDPVQALAAFWTNPTGFDALLVDYRMPSMSGAAFCEQVRRTGHDVPVSLISGHYGDLDAPALQRCGCTECLQKPFTLAQLAATLQRMLRR